MAYNLLNISMLYIKEKKNTSYQNIYYNFKYTKDEETDFFSFFKSIKSVQELWTKAIIFEKNFFLVPYAKNYLNPDYNKLYKFYSYDSYLYDRKKSQIEFCITNKLGIIIGLIKLTYIHDNKSIYIKHISYSKNHKQNILKNAISNLLDYFRKTFFIQSFFVSFDKRNKNESFFKSLAFKKNTNSFLKTSDHNIYIWKGLKKNIGRKTILTAGPSVSLLEASKSLDAAKNGWNNNWNTYIAELEQNFADYLGVKYAISTSSCTGALHIALQALGITKGDEVIVPDITWVATARVVTYLGAKPVFADIDKDTWNIDPKSIERLITTKTKAIIPVHLYGNPANLEELKKISLKYKIKLVEDAAPAIGSLFKGIKCGTIGDFSAFSFQGAKLLVSGEGGILCTNSSKLYKIAKKISDHGRNPNKTFWIDGPGLKYKISNIQAAFASGQLERVNHLILMKRRVFQWYKEFLRNNNFLSLLEENENSYSNYWMISIFLRNNCNNKRDKLIQYLRSNNIDSRPVFSPISEYPIWNKKHKPKKVAKLIGYSSLNLPSGTSLTQMEVKYICDKINNFFNL